jgi:hypothetical protein
MHTAHVSTIGIEPIPHRGIYFYADNVNLISTRLIPQMKTLVTKLTDNLVRTKMIRSKARENVCRLKVGRGSRRFLR